MRADLALVGFGNVGRCFARLLAQRRDWLALDYDLECRIVGIATRRHGAVYDALGVDGLAAAKRVDKGDSLSAALDSPGGSRDVITRLSSSDAPLRVVVETTTLDIAGGQPAIDHVVAALSRACDVITANKGPAAFGYDDLMTRAREAGRSFLCEGAVMDGVPVLNLVRETMPVVGDERASRSARLGAGGAVVARPHVGRRARHAR